MMQDIRFSMLMRKSHNCNIENVDDINKILFCETTGSVCKNITIGIDFEKGVAYNNVTPIKMDRVEPSVYLQPRDIEMLKDAMIYFNVKDWNQFYQEDNQDEIMDGYGWSLRIAGKDGEVEVHMGSGTKKSLVTPKGFAEFEKILLDLVCKVEMK